MEPGIPRKFKSKVWMSFSLTVECTGIAYSFVLLQAQVYPGLIGQADDFGVILPRLILWLFAASYVKIGYHDTHLLGFITWYPAWLK